MYQLLLSFLESQTRTCTIIDQDPCRARSPRLHRPLRLSPRRRHSLLRRLSLHPRLLRLLFRLRLAALLTWCTEPVTWSLFTRTRPLPLCPQIRVRPLPCAPSPWARMESWPMGPRTIPVTFIIWLSTRTRADL